MLLILRQSRWVGVVHCMHGPIDFSSPLANHPRSPRFDPTYASNPPTSAAPSVGQQHIQLMQLLEQIPLIAPPRRSLARPTSVALQPCTTWDISGP